MHFSDRLPGSSILHTEVAVFRFAIYDMRAGVRESSNPNPYSQIQNRNMPFSAIYARLTAFRRSLFEQGVYSSHSLGAPTISVGNITVGGTGKTPMVAYVAAFLAEEGEKVCVISRGYKRENPKDRVLVSDGETVLADPKSAGDEPTELAERLIGKAAVIADRDRVAAAAWARARFSPTVFVLDDAFQHFRARRDLDIVLVDATNPFGNRKTLPFGILREPLEELRRADLIVITRSNLVDQSRIAEIKTEIRDYAECPVICSRNQFDRFISIAGEPVERPSGRSLYAFCAIGNPSNFFDQLRSEGFATVGTRTFGDHHFYSKDDADAIQRGARAAGADLLITTGKDAVKLKGVNLKVECVVAVNGLEFDQAEVLNALLKQAVGPDSDQSPS